jgi:hypothetical protein
MTDEDEAFNEIERRSKVKQTLIVHASKEAMLLAKVTDYEALIRDLTDALRANPSRNDVLEEVANEFDRMKVLGDTATSFAAYVRGMKRDT